MSDSYEISKGSKCLVRTGEEEDAVGLFAGYVMMGSDTAMVLRMDGDRLRYIPVAQISYVDVLEAADSEAPRPTGTAGPYYG